MERSASAKRRISDWRRKLFCLKVDIPYAALKGPRYTLIRFRFSSDAEAT